MADGVRLTDAEREALGNWLRNRGVYSFGLLVDIADCVERILTARAEAECRGDAAGFVCLAADGGPCSAPAPVCCRYRTTDPYCPDHGTEPTTYDSCSCESRAEAERRGGSNG